MSDKSTDNELSSYDQIMRMLNMVLDQGLREKLWGMHTHLKERIVYWPASKKHHHAWVGGYADHVREVMMLAIHSYQNVNAYCETLPVNPLDFTLDDVILVAYVHDLDKLYRYKDMPEGDYRRQAKYGGQIWEVADGITYPDESAKVTQLCALQGIVLTDAQIEAVSHHHGGWSCNLSSPYAYMSDGSGMTKFSTLIHGADLMSGYIFGRKGKVNP
jgi:23S rRNA maturation-related 3'-5' exoribonuclease YhaM